MQKFPKRGDLAILAPIRNEDGTPNKDVTNQVAMNLFHLEEEAIRPSGPGMGSKFKSPPLMLNAYVLMSCNFKSKDYKEGLEYLSAAMGFFQAKAVFTPQNTPTLPSDVEKVTAELYTMTFEQVNHLWGALGGHQVPSVMYKLRMIQSYEGEILVDPVSVTTD